MSSCNVEALTMERFTVHFLLSSSLTLFFFMFIIFELEVNKNLSLYEFKVLCFYYLDRQFIPSQPCFLSCGNPIINFAKLRFHKDNLRLHRRFPLISLAFICYFLLNNLSFRSAYLCIYFLYNLNLFRIAIVR